LAALLVWMTFKPEQRPIEPRPTARADDVADSAAAVSRQIRRVGVALEAAPTDANMLAEAIAAARTHRAELILMHIVEGVGGQYHGPRADDVESRDDDQYLNDLTTRLKRDLDGQVAAVRSVLGFGDVQRELIRLVKRENLDLLVVGGHGHKGLADLVRGTTIDGVRHNLQIPVLAVRGKPENPKHQDHEPHAGSARTNQ
jgi:manganese transport protein